MPQLRGFRLNVARVQKTAVDLSINIPLNVKSWTLTLDRSQAPYATMTVVASLPADLDIAMLDPRLGRVLAVDPQYSDDGGATWQSVLSTAQIVAAGGQVNTPPFYLQVRSRYVDYLYGEMTLTATSWELLLQDYLRGSDWDPGTSTYLAATSNVLDSTGLPTWRNINSEVSAGIVSPSGVSNPATAAGTDVWTRNESALDYILQLAQGANAWFFMDLSGNCWWTTPTMNPDTMTTTSGSMHTIRDTDAVKSITETLDRSDPLFMNAVQITYLPPSGTPAYQFAAPTSNGPRKAVNLSSGGVKPNTASAAATAVAQKGAQRGRVLQVTAIADLNARPNQNWQVYRGDAAWSGLLRAVTFRMPDGLMDMTIEAG